MTKPIVRKTVSIGDVHLQQLLLLEGEIINMNYDFATRTLEITFAGNEEKALFDDRFTEAIKMLKTVAQVYGTGWGELPTEETATETEAADTTKSTEKSK